MTFINGQSCLDDYILFFTFALSISIFWCTWNYTHVTFKCLGQALELSISKYCGMQKYQDDCRVFVFKLISISMTQSELHRRQMTDSIMISILNNESVTLPQNCRLFLHSSSGPEPAYHLMTWHLAALGHQQMQCRRKCWAGFLQKCLAVEDYEYTGSFSRSWLN